MKCAVVGIYEYVKDFFIQTSEKKPMYFFIGKNQHCDKEEKNTWEKSVVLIIHCIIFMRAFSMVRNVLLQ